MLCFILGNSCSLGLPVVLFALVLNIILNSSHTLAYKQNALWGVDKKRKIQHMSGAQNFTFGLKRFVSMSRTCVLYVLTRFIARYRCVEYALNMFGARLMHASVRYIVPY